MAPLDTELCNGVIADGYTFIHSMAQDFISDATKIEQLRRVTASYTTQSDGTLFVTYAGGAAGSIVDPNNPDRTSSGIIAYADVIGVVPETVPEPTTWAFLCVAVVMIGSLRRWELVCLRKP